MKKSVAIVFLCVILVIAAMIIAFKDGGPPPRPNIPSLYGYSHTTGSERFLRPGQSEIVRVVAPIHQTAWRQVFYFTDATLGRRLNIALRRTPLRTLAKDLPGEYIKKVIGSISENATHPDAQIIPSLRIASAALLFECPCLKLGPSLATAHD